MNSTPIDPTSQDLLPLAQRIISHTPILFSNDHSVEPVSSSFLVRWKLHHFLITTGHTLKKHDYDKLGLIFPNTFLPLSGSSTVSTAKNIDLDRIDIGLCYLSDNFLSQLSLSTQFSFYNLEYLDVDHDDSTIPDYLIAGHPITSIKMKEAQRKILGEPFIFKTDLISSNSYYKSMSLRRDAHLILNYRKRRIYNILKKDPVQGPSPVGLSGSAVWRLPKTSDINTESQYFPTGMITEYFSEKSAIVATRMRLVTEAIRQAYSIDMPKSNKITVNLIRP